MGTEDSADAEEGFQEVGVVGGRGLVGLDARERVLKVRRADGAPHILRVHEQRLRVRVRRLRAERAAAAAAIAIR